MYQQTYVVYGGYCISSLVCARTEVIVAPTIEVHSAPNSNAAHNIDSHVLNDCLLLACRMSRRLMCCQTYIQQEQHISARSQLPAAAHTCCK